jgi:hypothetical protein
MSAVRMRNFSGAGLTTKLSVSMRNHYPWLSAPTLPCLPTEIRWSVDEFLNVTGARLRVFCSWQVISGKPRKVEDGAYNASYHVVA